MLPYSQPQPQQSNGLMPPPPPPASAALQPQPPPSSFPQQYGQTLAPQQPQPQRYPAPPPPAAAASQFPYQQQQQQPPLTPAQPSPYQPQPQPQSYPPQPSQPQQASPYAPAPSPYPQQPPAAASPYAPMPAPNAASYPPQQQQQPQRPVIPDYVVPVHPKYLSLTCSVFPNSNQLRQHSQIPFGAVLRPLADPPSSPASPSPSPSSSVPGAPPPVVNPAAHGVIRCNECRTYVNPYVEWLDSGGRWRCNICHLANDVPPAYFSPLDQWGRRLDVLSRPELVHGTVDIIAPADYMVRQPMPPTFFFLIDVSQAAVQSGVLQTVAETVAACIQSLPGDKRTLIGFMTFDSALHFYTLKAGGGGGDGGSGSGSGVSMWVCSDLEDVFLPQPNDLLVNLDECRPQVLSFLSSLPSMFSSSHDVESCFGSALEGAVQVLSRIGGRLLCFLSCLPSLGAGRLVNREQSRLLGSDKESSLLQAAQGMDFYKKKAVAFTKYQICCDAFVFSEQYMDIATLADLSRLSGGQLSYYPGYSAATRQHAEKVRKELTRCLTRSQGWEAVIRIRAMKGVQVTDFNGNFFLRGSDLLALPGIDSDKAFTFELRSDDTVLQERAVCVQSALLYTTSSGERRIRVHTACLPVTANLLELYERVNTNAMVNVMVKSAIRVVYAETLDKAREAIRNRTVVLLRTYRPLIAKTQTAPSQELALLPLMTLGALKCLGLKEGSDVRSDVRAFLLSLMYSMGIVELETFIRPRMLPVHNMRDGEGMPVATGGAAAAASTDEPPVIQLPQECALTAQVLQSDSAYLLDNGLEFLLRIGKAVDPAFLHALFGLQSLQGVDAKQLVMREDGGGGALLQRVRNVMEYLRAVSSHYQCLFVVKEGEPTEVRFFNLLIEDRSHTAMALSEFEQFIHRQQY